jgi:hypothetical protein
MSCGVALSSSAAFPKLGRSVIETFFYILRKRASLVPDQSFDLRTWIFRERTARSGCCRERNICADSRNTPDCSAPIERHQQWLKGFSEFDYFIILISYYLFLFRRD